MKDLLVGCSIRHYGVVRSLIYILSTFSSRPLRTATRDNLPFASNGRKSRKNNMNRVYIPVVSGRFDVYFEGCQGYLLYLQMTMHSFLGQSL